MNYNLALSIAKNMLSQGIINQKEYRKSSTILAAKYKISLSSIFREKNINPLDVPSE